MNDDLNIWLDGAPVIPAGNGEFTIWLDNAPVVVLGGNDATSEITGTECITETGTCTATGGAVATVTGTEVLTETGTVDAIGVVYPDGTECLTETGTCTATGGATCTVTGVECVTETGEIAFPVLVTGIEMVSQTGAVFVTIISPVIPPGFAGTIPSRRLHTWDFKKHHRNRPDRYYRRKREVCDPEFVCEPEEIARIQPEKPVLTAVARVHGSEIQSSTGICNVLIDHPDDLETIQLILESLNLADSLPDNPVFDESEDLEAILMALSVDD